MCCLADKNATEEMRKQIAAGQTTFYKLYEVGHTTENDGLATQNVVGRAKSPYYRSDGGWVTWNKDGEIVSNRENTSVEWLGNSIFSNILGFGTTSKARASVDKGIHVYAKPQYTHGTHGLLIEVPVAVSVEDFVACNEDGSHAVFTKVKVDPVAFQKALTERAMERLEDEDFDEDDEDDEDDCDDDDCCDDCGSPYCNGDCDDDDDYDDDYDEDDDDEDE